jgi:hypothetical protein
MSIQNPNGEKPNVAPGATVKMTDATRQRVAQMAQQHALAGAVSNIDILRVSAASKVALFESHKAAGKPMPTVEECAAARNVALTTARVNTVAASGAK